MGVCTRSSETLFTKWYYENYKWGKMIVFGPSLNFTDGYFCKVQESSSVNCFHLNCEIELLTHMNLCEQGGLIMCVSCVCVLLFSQCERTCCFGKRMDPRSGWTLFPWTDSAVCVCLCVRACVRVSRLKAKGVGERARNRSISFLLWQSGDLRCMASCDPDSFLFSPLLLLTGKVA